MLGKHKASAFLPIACLQVVVVLWSRFCLWRLRWRGRLQLGRENIDVQQIVPHKCNSRIGIWAGGPAFDGASRRGAPFLRFLQEWGC